jgi:thioredoxin reductase (NADPH)
VVIATGVRYRKLDLPRLDEFEGRSIYYEATQVEALMCRGAPVVVVGGGNAAGQATLFLAQQAGHVCLVVRNSDLEKSMSRYLADRIQRDAGVEVLLHTELRELIGHDGQLEALVVEDTRTGERRMLAARTLFVFIGAEPNTAWLGGNLALDEHGCVLTGASLPPRGGGGPSGPEGASVDRSLPGPPPLSLETSRPGVFAVGDVRSGSVKRVASAVGEGAMAIHLVHDHLAR